jgi:DegV family protein with EDD domain
MYSVAQADELGITIIPLLVRIDGNNYRDTEDITPEEFVKLIDEGNIPTSSQPIIGEVEDVFKKYPDDEIFVLCMADGLSGTYQSTCSARLQAPNPENIHVINTQTLCGPHRYLTEMAMKMIKDGCTSEQLMSALYQKIDTSVSFLIPQDFEFLKRGGRCTPLTARLGGLLHLVPVVQETKDGKHLDKFTTARSFSIAIKRLISFYQETGTANQQVMYISHAFAEVQAEEAAAAFHQAFPEMKIVMQELTVAFITQGGPRCIAVQTIEA